MAEVTYKGIDGFPGYRVGDDGSVWSRRFRNRIKGITLADYWKKVPGHRRPYGYTVVALRETPQAKIKIRYVHRLVLEAFVGPCPEGMECCHRDGNATNNRLENLRWDTHKNNFADGVRRK